MLDQLCDQPPAYPAEVLTEYRRLAAIDDARWSRWEGLTGPERAAMRARFDRDHRRPEAILPRHWEAFRFRFCLEAMDLVPGELAGLPPPRPIAVEAVPPEVAPAGPPAATGAGLTDGQRAFVEGLTADQRARFDAWPEGRRAMVLGWFTVDVQPPMLREALGMLGPVGPAAPPPPVPDPTPTPPFRRRRSRRRPGRVSSAGGVS